jgi:hypothetical protein
MKSYVSVCALALVVGACSGSNPFTVVDAGTGTPATPTTSGVPAAIQSDLTSFVYDPVAQTLSVTGIDNIGNTPTTVFRRRANLDVMAPNGTVAYEAYTAQAGPLNEHATSYVKTISDVTAAVVVTGGQFTQYEGGAVYSRNGSYSPAPVSAQNSQGLVEYAGSYIGLSNVNGPTTDITPVVGTPSPGIVTSQASQVNGDMFIVVDFGNSTLRGVIQNRVLTAINNNTGATVIENVPDLALIKTDVADDGTFNGSVEILGNTDVGTFAGILGGPESEAIAGGIFVDNHFEDQREGEEEFGIFVLGQCGTSSTNDPATCALSVP